MQMTITKIIIYKMARKTRPDLKIKSAESFPTNLQKRITALIHRLYNTDNLDSHFNWLSDELPLAYWDKDNNITLIDYLEGGIASIKGTVVIGDVGGASAPNLMVTGDIVSSDLVDIGDEADIIVRFQSLGTSDYMPIVTLKSDDLNDANNDIGLFYTHSYTNTSFKINLEDKAGSLQDLTLLIQILKL